MTTENDPNLQSSSAREAKMVDAARLLVIESGDFAAARALTPNGLGVEDLETQLHEWTETRQIFTIQDGSVELYPRYSLEHGNRIRPLPVIAEILRIFERCSPWEIAFWFAGINSYLGGVAPKEIVSTQSKAVLNAATTEMTGLRHG